MENGPTMLAKQESTSSRGKGDGDCDGDDKDNEKDDEDGEGEHDANDGKMMMRRVMSDYCWLSVITVWYMESYHAL